MTAEFTADLLAPVFMVGRGVFVPNFYGCKTGLNINVFKTRHFEQLQQWVRTADHPSPGTEPSWDCRSVRTVMNNEWSVYCTQAHDTLFDFAFGGTSSATQGTEHCALMPPGDDV
jgi:hypothetical protein